VTLRTPRSAAITFICIGLATLAGSAAAGSSFELPPLTHPASHQQHFGKVIWADLATPDSVAAQHFYGALFGWTFVTVPGDPNYTLATFGGAPVAGFYQKAMTDERKQPAWLPFLSVKNVDATAKAAVSTGGRILSDPRSFPRRGRQAVLADPEGAVFAVMSARDGDPPDYLAAPGEWIWSSVMVRDTERETAFYRALVGYEVYDLAQESDAAETPGDTPVATGQHFVLAQGGYARAGLHVLPNDSLRRHPHWINFVRVGDAVASAQKAVALGGRVLVEPHLDRHGGQLAILADPQGAPFGVMEWSEDESTLAHAPPGAQSP
jgi:uncharacterized protein